MTTIPRHLRVPVLFLVLFGATVAPWPVRAAQEPRTADAGGAPQFSPDEMRVWLEFLASDELQGRQVFTEGYGLAAQYVASHLERWGVKPLGANGGYLQPVRVRGYRATRNSSLTIDSGGQSRTFRHGDHVTFAANAAAKQTLSFTGVEFVGYGRPADYEGRDVKGKLVVSVPNLAPPPGRGAGPAQGAAPQGGRAGGNAAAINAGAAAAIVLAPAPAAPSPEEQALAQAQEALARATAAVADAQQALRGRGAGRGGAGRGGGGRGAGRGTTTPDFTTVQRIDRPVPPQITGDATLFEALFSGSGIAFADVLARAQKGESISPASLPARVTVTIDNTYELVSQQVTHNVVGLIEGSDPTLKDTYVLLGAHLDHAGYSSTGGGRGSGTDACRRRSPAAQAAVRAAGRTVQRPDGRGGARAGGTGSDPVVPFEERDVINNGADDDASGSVALMAIAKAFAEGPKPKRSIVVAWHSGEESGLYGSRYNADYPVVPIERVEAHLNMDMIGRDDCDNIEGDFSNTVFVVGADRISTDLHNVIVEANRRLPSPLTLDYELNDPADPENIYTRSDHFSYASKGIPSAFFTTGLHPDYHRVTDTAAKILFPKMARIAQLVYETGFAVADSERPLVRDNKGPRTGFGSKAEPLR